MGNRHGSSDASATPDGLPREERELCAALECEAEGDWVAGLLADEILTERLTPEVRSAALAAFASEAELLERLLPEALEVEAAQIEAGQAETQAKPLEAAARASALAAEATARLDDLLEETFGIEAATEATAALRPSARATALAAWDAEQAAAEDAAAEPAPRAMDEAAPVLVLPTQQSRRTPRAEPLRARRMQAPLLLRPLAAAAMLLLAFGAGLFLFGGDEEAEAGLQLRALSRRNLASTIGMSQIEPGYFASLGRVYAPGEGELLSFGFAYDGLVVVGAGDTVRVTHPGTPIDRVPGAAPVVLRLESGEARLATREAPIPLEVNGIGLLVLEEGAAHVALHAEAPDGAPAVALAERSVARFHRADGTSVPLAGPTRVLLAADGVRSFGTPARSLFRELAFFGGPRPATTQVRRVSARLFEIRAGAVRRGRQDVRIVAASPQAAASARFAWRPPLALADARRLRVALRAPVGTVVALAQEGRDDVEARVERTHGGSAHGAGEPGVSTVELVLDRDWYERLPGGRIHLTVSVPGVPPAEEPTSATGNANTTSKSTSRRKPVRAWFDGISLVLGTAEDGLPNTAGAASSDTTKSVPNAQGGR